DPDGQVTGITSDLMGATLTDNGDGTWQFSYTPGYDEAGERDVVFTIQSQTGDFQETSHLIIENVNTIPTLPNGESLNIDVTKGETPAPVQIVATDLDGDSLTYVLDPALDPPQQFQSWMHLNQDTGLITFDKVPDDALSQYVYTIVVSDGVNEINLAFTIDVNEVLPNNPPTLAEYSADLGSVEEGTTRYFYLPEAEDADGDELTYTLDDSAPEWITFYSTAKIIVARPGYEDAGADYPIVVHVSDGRGGTATYNYMLDVTEGDPLGAMLGEYAATRDTDSSSGDNRSGDAWLDGVLARGGVVGRMQYLMQVDAQREEERVQKDLQEGRTPIQEE
ncbi:MAG: putative Ig domain-containing protein, partial [Candidatus Omnitrophica bacterium]|nr:putative Ig domain-containing protein [Candidatus Omnitrophota bacterium]